MELKSLKALDRTDRSILALLSEEGRIGWTELAERVGLSPTPVIRRLKALEESGFIRGYSARLDEAQLGFPVSVFVSVALEAQDRKSLAEFEERVATFPEVMSCHMMSGGTDYLLRVVVPDLETYRSFVTDKLSTIEGVQRLSSSFALKTVLQRSTPPLR